MFPWSILNWMILSIICQPAASVLQYTMEELLQLHFNRFESTPDLHFYTDMFKPRRTYIHRGSRRNYKFDDSNSIRPSGHPLRVWQGNWNKLWTTVLSHIGRLTITKSTTDTLTFGLFNICSINNKAPPVWDLLNDCKFEFLCLIKIWQQQNGFSQLNQSILLGFAYACQPCVSGQGGGLAMLYNKKWKASIAVPSYFWIHGVTS